MPSTVPKDTDLVEAIAACLKEDDVVGKYVEGQIGRVGTFENLPRYIEIGHTREDPVAGSTRRPAPRDDPCLVDERNVEGNS